VTHTRTQIQPNSGQCSGTSGLRNLPNIDSLGPVKFLSSTAFLAPPYFCFFPFSNLLGNPFVKLICLGLIWGYLHHFCAGIRYLFLDLEIGVDKAAANRSAVSVMVISLTLTAILGLRLFGLF
jgi:succinate dehydrogenase cytochrome b556 subunit